MNSLSPDAQSVLKCIEEASAFCAWVSWAPASKKHRHQLSTTEALKIKELLRGDKLQAIVTLSHALVEICSYETPEQTKLRIDNVNETTAPLDSFGSFLDMLRSFAESKEDGRKATPAELIKVYSILELMAGSLAKALMKAWESNESEGKEERERKISVILQHLTCHGALGWTDGNMPFVFTCVHPAQSHYTTGAAKAIMEAVADTKRFVQAVFELSTAAADAGILEFATFFLRQMIVTLSAPKALMQAYRLVLRFMIDLVKKQKEVPLDAFDPKLDILYPLTRGIIFHYPRDTRNQRGGIDEIYWTSGLVEDILDLIHNIEDEVENNKVHEKYRISAMTAIFSLTRVVEFRVLLRDMNMINVIIMAYNAANPKKEICKEWDEKVSDMLMNMSERDDIKTRLKNSEALVILELMIKNYQPQDASRLFSLIAIAHIYGSDDLFEETASDAAMEHSQSKIIKQVIDVSLLTMKNNGLSDTRAKLRISDSASPTPEEMKEMSRQRDFQMKAESILAGRLLKENNLSEWLFEKLLQAMEDGTATIVAAGFTIFLNTEDVIHAIQSISSNKEAAKNMGEKSPGLFSSLLKMLKGERARDPEDNNREVLIKTLGCLLNFTDVKELRTAIEKAEKRAEIEEVLAMLEKKEKDQDDQRIVDLINGVQANLNGRTERAEEMLKKIDSFEEEKVLFDVFLSHKRTDAKDFCRGLYNLLQADGIDCFLDFEFREELSKLEEIVGRCTNFIFVLTDNVFDSPWCIKELQAAVEMKKNIILVTKDGSRWKDANGGNTCLFPPYEVINKLPKEVQKAFDSKAIAHSDEYYQAFKDQLLRRIKRKETTTTPPPADPCWGRPPAAGSPGADFSFVQAPQLSAPLGQMYVDSTSLSEAMVTSERMLSKTITNSERTLREQITGSEQAISNSMINTMRVHSHDLALLVQSIEQRLNTKIEERLREIKMEVIASSQGLKEAIDRGLSTTNSHGQWTTPPSPGAGSATYAFPPLESPMAGAPRTSADISPSSQLMTYHGSPSSLTMMSSSPMTRVNRPVSSRPQSGRPSSYQSPQQQSRGSIGASMNVKGLTASSPRI